MRKVLLGSGLLAACLASSANAGFLGFAGDSYSVNVSGTDYWVIDVYAMYQNLGATGSAPNYTPVAGGDKFLNVFNSDIGLINATNFYQSNDTYAATNSGSNAADSKVATGGATGNTSPDGSFFNFDSDGGDPTLPPSPGAGWFTGNPNPANGSNGAKAIVAQGNFDNDTGSNLGVFIGRFSVLANADGGGPVFLHFASSVGSGLVGQSGSTTSADDETFAYVPAPGALALLGLAGLAGRRRRA